VHPRAGWDDLVLRPEQVARLREVEARARHADLVLIQWGMGSGSRRRGIIALFAGPPGTGKTMAAEVLGDALGLDLYVINLATVIDKYIGETEKNLERVFEAAAGVNGILFFDEADALFGKRSEVKDARDRYANVETAYLLQRLERFEGTAILATNLMANIDDAFSRRIDVFVDFPLPEASERGRIWRSALAGTLPTGDDVDVAFLANAFELGGGNIVNVVVTAAFMAAERSGRVGMEELIRATGREYRKLGRLCTRTEFGPHLHLAEAG
jgi:SpoVK/Ycf46/Vps4 family AAA+-type ATPase